MIYNKFQKSNTTTEIFRKVMKGKIQRTYGDILLFQKRPILLSQDLPVNTWLPYLSAFHRDYDQTFIVTIFCWFYDNHQFIFIKSQLFKFLLFLAYDVT
jgi:hypothetical protein